MTRSAGSHNVYKKDLILLGGFGKLKFNFKKRGKRREPIYKKL